VSQHQQLIGGLKMQSSDGVSAIDSGAAANDGLLLAGLLRGEEAAFLSLISQYQASMQRICRMYVSDPAIAEEVVQDTWLSMQGLRRLRAAARSRPGCSPFWQQSQTLSQARATQRLFGLGEGLNKLSRRGPGASCPKVSRGLVGWAVMPQPEPHREVLYPKNC
jgi:hypothetical protein